MNMFLRPNTQLRVQSAAVMVGTAIAAWAADQAAALAPPAPVAAPAVAAAPVAGPAASHSTFPYLTSMGRAWRPESARGADLPSRQAANSFPLENLVTKIRFGHQKELVTKFVKVFGHQNQILVIKTYVLVTKVDLVTKKQFWSPFWSPNLVGFFGFGHQFLDFGHHFGHHFGHQFAFWSPIWSPKIKVW